jgi:glycosyltransferase involved in cell wall biosynthesis
MTLEGVQVRPKILFVTSHWPLAPAYGAQQRVVNLGRLLSRFGDLSLVIVPTDPEDEETVRRTEREFKVRKVIRPSLTKSERLFRRTNERFRHEFDPTYLATDPYVVNDQDRKGLQELIQQHDLVWVHTIRTANWFRIYKWPASVLDVDDLPSRQLMSAAHASSSVVGRLLDMRRSMIWQRRERLLSERFSVLSVCSEDDRKYLGFQKSVHVIPNGCHPLPAQRSPSVEFPRIGLIGNYMFPPNAEGAKWFIRAVWPMIKSKLPSAQLRLIGRGSEGRLTGLGPDIEGLGWLEDPEDEIASWSAMIVPIRTGSGTRVKLAEGFARKCPVVATTIGAFGYNVHHGEELLLADRAKDFASACVLLLSDPSLRDTLSERAHKRFLHEWTWDSFEGTVGAVIEECLARKACSATCQ